MNDDLEINCGVNVTELKVWDSDTSIARVVLKPEGVNAR